jgi:hypothetical protein
MAAEPNCAIGLHWMGVYYMGCHGVAMNLDKSEARLLKAHKWATPSQHSTILLCSTIELKKDFKKAYLYLKKAVLLGVTFFDNITNFFKENFDLLAPVFC